MREVSLGVVWGMFAETVVMLSLGVAFFVVTFFLHQQTSKALFLQFESWKEDFLNARPRSFDEIKDELLDIVEDTLQNMQPPNAGDHFLGIFAQVGQMWAMRKFDIDPATGAPRPQIDAGELVEEFINRQ